MRTAILRLALTVLTICVWAFGFSQQQHVKWSLSVVKGDTGGIQKLDLHAQIDPGWHLYSIVPVKGEGPVPTTVTVKAPLVAAGNVEETKPISKLDPNFNLQVNFFQDSADFIVPVKGDISPTSSVDVKFQLCNDTTCIPPSTVNVPLAGSGSGSHTPQHVTWSLSVVKGDTGGLQKLDLHAQIDPGWHLYSIVPVKGEGPVPTSVTVKAPLVAAGAVQETKPISKLDPNFNLVVNFFQDGADFMVPVKGDISPSSSVDVKFQLCNDTTCIPPSTINVTIGGGGSAAAAGAAAKPGAADDDYSKQVQKAKSDGLFAFLLFSFTAGLLSLLTPCVFPMIPITVSYFSKRRGEPGSKTSLAQPIAYCVGIVGSFTVFGVVVSILFGASGIQRFATNPYVNIALAALFVVLALSLLGIYQINLPSGLVNKFNGSRGKDGLLAPALMGLTFTLTSFTCTVAFVGTILASASQGDYVYPLLGMLAYGTAFALPFFLLAIFPQYLARLPKSGSWLETVKAFMGFIEIAAALKFLSNADLVLQTNLISRPIFLGTWAFIAFAAGLFLIGAMPLPNMERPKKIGPWRFGFAVMSIVLAIFFTMSVPGRSLGELEAFMPPTDHGWGKSYSDALALAQRTNRPIFVNFTGVTCTNCRWMESNMFSQRPVKKALGSYITVELYTDRETAGDMANKALEEKLTGTDALPEYVELAPDGKKVADFPGLTRSREQFISFLKRASVGGLQAKN